MKQALKLNNFLLKTVDSIQNYPISFAYLALTFLGITLLRNYFELYATQNEFNLEHFVHYTLFFLALALTFTVILNSFTRESVIQTLRLVVLCFLIIWIPPFIDVIVSGFGGQQMAYILNHEHLLMRYFTFFGPLQVFGITIGMRVEIALVIAGTCWFLYTKTRSVLSALIGGLVTYTTIFIYVALPAIINLFLSLFGNSVDAKLIPFIKIYLLISLCLVLRLSYVANRDLFIAIVKDIRPLRLLHFQFMFILGVCLAVYFGNANHTALTTFSALVNWILVFVSITFAWVYSVMINNLEDTETDAVSNPERITVSGEVDSSVYRSLSWWILFGSISAAALVGFDHLFLVLTFIAVYFLYSAPPLRLKRILILSKGLIAMNSLLLVTAGYTFLNPELQFTVPDILLPIFLLGFTMVLNFIDLKDYEGDKHAGIKTLPVVFGMNTAKQIIGVSFIATYLSAYAIVQNIYVLPVLLLVGISQYLLVTKKVWEEWKVLSLHLAALIPAFVYLLIM